MLWVPQKGVLRCDHNTGTVGATTVGTAVTTGASASTKGTPAQLIASTAFDAYWIRVCASAYASSGAASDGSLDIMVGAATEEIIIPDLLMGYCGDPVTSIGGMAKTWDFPLYIPAGTRISAQAAGVRTATAMRVAIFLYGGDGYPPFRVGSKVVTYGMGTVPNATAVTPGASGAEGSWTQITASTSESHFAIVPSLQQNNNTNMVARALAMDIGVGAATEEEILQSSWWGIGSTETVAGPMNGMPCFQDIPAATRLTARMSCSGTTSGTYEVALHAVS
ncbi:MAG TPA: hypothetical protein VL494_13805 [Steroidobacteraceae bacterium]|jgi:hypothetical protein|nr:hypothetical protein [Steroidobacteraceae bacterium]